MRYIYITTEAFIVLQHVTAVVSFIEIKSGTVGMVRGQKISKHGVRIMMVVMLSLRNGTISQLKDSKVITI